MTTSSKNKPSSNDKKQTGAGHPAKLWDIIRLNPLFRFHVNELTKQRETIQLLPNRNTKNIATFLSEADKDNPLAALALRWVFEPRFFEPANLVAEYSSGHESRELEMLSSMLPYIPLPELKSYLWPERKLFYLFHYCPFYVHRHRLRPFVRNEPLGPLIVDNLRTSHKSTLSYHDGDFTPDTAWNKTPAAFRLYLQWIWAHYDFNAKNPMTGTNRLFLPNPQTIELIGDTVFSSHKALNIKRLAGSQKEYLKDEWNLILLGIPKMTFVEADFDAIFNELKDHLKPWMEETFCTLNGNAYEHLLGSDGGWKLFKYFIDEGGIRYKIDPAFKNSPLRFDVDFPALKHSQKGSPIDGKYVFLNKPIIRTGSLFKASKKYSAEHRGFASEKSKHSSNDKAAVERIEKLMNFTYPGFDYRHLFYWKPARKDDRKQFPLDNQNSD